ncbi:B-box zinc finger protein 20-like [Magnolia sinica]|uniref:B-box zinc finger protein 20-like n=1 Tax=Magnolia sinica TaxID=86752 RepID=UPI0026588E8E|nr:B-box zinc finger protein 20-like [Magnolia sinica]
MKIQCDGCNREEASVFCSADEAALCDGCDRRVHHANKLAGKHHRFSLLNPSSKDAPRCDICQERRAFLFCREDRAILCRECDLPIHTANEMTKKHNRFLLTGVKLSSSSSTSTPAQFNNMSQAIDNGKKSVSFETNLATEKTSTDAARSEEEACTSSISEYLIKMLPGWHVEDLLDSSATDGLCKTTDDLFPFLDADLESDSVFGSNDLPIWVPQVPPYLSAANGKHGATGFKDFKEMSNPRAGKRWNDDGFEVPQFNPPSKRSRPNWQIG